MVSEVWEARCIGNTDVILDLLSDIAFLGKKRSIGFGEIYEWLIAPGDFETALVRDRKFAHGIPAGCGLFGSGTPLLVGWTPPQWKVSLHSEGWAVGDRMACDWYKSAGVL
jgi:hypothetical protein